MSQHVTGSLPFISAASHWASLTSVPLFPYLLLHIVCTVYNKAGEEGGLCRLSFEPRLFVPDSLIFLQSCETKSGTEILGSRLV